LKQPTHRFGFARGTLQFTDLAVKSITLLLLPFYPISYCQQQQQSSLWFITNETIRTSFGKVFYPLTLLKINKMLIFMNIEVIFQLVSIALVVIVGPAVVGILYAQKSNL